MSYFKRIKDIVSGLLMLLFAFLIVISPEEMLPFIVIVLAISMFIRGFRLLYYYISMARHMVGGKSVLYRSIIVFDAAILLTTAIPMSRQIVMFYLLFIYAFYGAIDVLRALEAKSHGARWKFKFFSGIFEVLFAIALLVAGMFVGNPVFIVYGYAISLVYTAIVRIVGAFRKTAIVYVTT